MGAAGARALHRERGLAQGDRREAAREDGKETKSEETAEEEEE